MKLIAHRGLTKGPNSSLENHPKQIASALAQGYDCEVDFWVVEHSCHNRYYLGHDRPTYEIDWDFIEQPGLWIHAKNLTALYLLGADNKLNFFWHQEDDFTLTSQGHIWTYPGKNLTSSSVCVMPEWQDPKFENLNKSCFGVCSDYIEIIKGLV